MKLAKKSSDHPTTLKVLEKQARLHVKEKYLGGFLLRHESSITYAAILTISGLIGYALCGELAMAAITEIFYWSLAATVLFVEGFSLYACTVLTVREFRKAPDAPWPKKLSFVVIGVLAFLVFSTVMFLLALLLLAWAALPGLSPLMNKIMLLAMSISMPLAVVTAGLRKYLAHEEMLPPELVKSGFFERRKLRTAKGAIQRYLLDQITEMEKKSLGSIEELLIKASVSIKRSGEFVAEFRASGREEKRKYNAVPDYLRDAYRRAKQLDESCREKRDQLEEHRSSVTAYFKACRERVNGLDKMYRDRNLIAEFQEFDRQAKNLPRDIDECIAQTSMDMLNDAGVLESSLAQLQSEAEISAAVAALPDASMESLEKLEEVIAKCVDLEVPKLKK